MDLQKFADTAALKEERFELFKSFFIAPSDEVLERVHSTDPAWASESDAESVSASASGAESASVKAKVLASGSGSGSAQASALR